VAHAAVFAVYLFGFAHLPPPSVDVTVEAQTFRGTLWVAFSKASPATLRTNSNASLWLQLSPELSLQTA
jgi:hypothetical protein